MNSLEQRIEIINKIKNELLEIYKVETFIYKTIYNNEYVLATKDSRSYNNDELINYVENRSIELTKIIIIPIIWIKNI